jgi:hypothetical protein
LGEYRMVAMLLNISWMYASSRQLWLRGKSARAVVNTTTIPVCAGMTMVVVAITAVVRLLNTIEEQYMLVPRC